MKQHYQLQQIFNWQLAGKRALRGAGIAMATIFTFLCGCIVLSRTDLGFGGMVILPIYTVTIAGACGGIFYHLMDVLRSRGTWQKVVANIISGLVFFVGCWLSLVAALAVTGHWH